MHDRPGAAAVLAPQERALRVASEQYLIVGRIDAQRKDGGASLARERLESNPGRIWKRICDHAEDSNRRDPKREQRRGKT